MFIFSLASLGLYLLYWIYSRAYALNRQQDNVVSINALNGFVAVYLVLFVAGFFPDMVNQHRDFFMIGQFIYLGFLIKVVIDLKNGFERLLGRRLNLFWAILFSAFYFQFQINKTNGNGGGHRKEHGETENSDTLVV